MSALRQNMCITFGSSCLVPVFRHQFPFPPSLHPSLSLCLSGWAFFNGAYKLKKRGLANCCPLFMLLTLKSLPDLLSLQFMSLSEFGVLFSIFFFLFSLSLSLFVGFSLLVPRFSTLDHFSHSSCVSSVASYHIVCVFFSLI